MFDTFTLLGGLTSILNPHIFNVGVEIIRAINTTPGTCSEKRDIASNIGSMEHTIYSSVADEQPEDPCPSGQRIELYSQ